MIIRDESPADFAAVEEIHRAAFGQDAEPELVAALRKAGAATVSLVATDSGEIVGHILFSPVTLEQGSARTLGLAPMAVLPGRQRSGVGSALVRAGLAKCKELGYEAVIVLGHIDYYPKFGFAPAHEFGLSCVYEVPPEAFMAIELREDALADASGVARYHAAFEIFE